MTLTNERNELLEQVGVNRVLAYKQDHLEKPHSSSEIKNNADFFPYVSSESVRRKSCTKSHYHSSMFLGGGVRETPLMVRYPTVKYLEAPTAHKNSGQNQT